jgi:hypothetical protein
MALPLPRFFMSARFAGAAPPVLREADVGELAAVFFVAPRAGEDAAALALAGAFFEIAMSLRYYFSWSCIRKSLCFRLSFTARWLSLWPSTTISHYLSAATNRRTR